MAYASEILGQVVVAVMDNCSDPTRTDCSTLEAKSAIGFEIGAATMERIGSYFDDHTQNEKEEPEGHDSTHWADNYSIVNRCNSYSVSMMLVYRSESMHAHLYSLIWRFQCN